MNWWLQALGVVALLLIAGLLALLVWRRTPQDTGNAHWLTALSGATERLARELRSDISHSASQGRQELTQTLRAAQAATTDSLAASDLAIKQTFAAFQHALQTQSGEAARTQNAQFDAFAVQLAGLQKTVANAVHELNETNARRMNEVRATMELQLQNMQQSNASKLDEMRHTVDEKLQATLQTRLGESFRQVADRLDMVHKGLGEMQSLAQGVGDLKHLLTNVKTRGIFGEAQLAGLLEQVFTADQYAAQIAPRPDSRERVDFAIKLPGQSADDTPLWLPIDAKFPNDDYERLLDAQSHADADAAAAAGRALEARIRQEAKSISSKYIAPPHTTDFAILFLPSEGLYAEVLRRPGLMQALQREHRITLAGPTTLLAMLSSLQMGFRTLALEKRSSEVWQVLGAVKTEFGKFGDVLVKARQQTQTVLTTLDSAEQRSRVMGKALRKVHALPDGPAQRLLAEDEKGGSV
jgi:DNA recombination protein RmuC